MPATHYEFHIMKGIALDNERKRALDKANISILQLTKE